MQYQTERNSRIFFQYVNSDKTNGVVRKISEQENISIWRVYSILHEHKTKVLTGECVKYACAKALVEEYRDKIKAAVEEQDLCIVD